MASSPFAESRLTPLTETFLHCKDPCPMQSDCTQESKLKETWAVNKFGPSALRRRHSIGGYVPHFLANLKSPRLDSPGKTSRRRERRFGTCPPELTRAASPEAWPNTDDEMEQSVRGDDRMSSNGDAFEPASPSPRFSDSSRSAMSAGPDDVGERVMESEFPKNEAECTSAVKITTMMIRNLPHSVAQTELLTELDNSGFEALYNFVYVPSSFEMHSGKGYAFVNFVSPAAAMSLLGAWHGSRRFCGPSPSSNGGGALPLNISPAHVQGLEANVKKWERMSRVRDARLRPFIVPSAPSRTTTMTTNLGGTLDSFLGGSLSSTWRTEASPASHDFVRASAEAASASWPTSCSSPAFARGSPSMAQQGVPLALGRFGAVGGAVSTLPLPPAGRRDLALPAMCSPTSWELAPPAAVPALAVELQEGITTLMLRNVPVPVSQQMLRDELDRSGFADLYDFAYLPSSFEAHECKGYAFLNFVTPAAAAACVGAWQRSRRFVTRDPTALPLNISAATVQGLEANARKWSGPRMHRIRNPALRPFVRMPGQTSPTSPTPGAASSTNFAAASAAAPPSFAGSSFFGRALPAAGFVGFVPAPPCSAPSCPAVPPALPLPTATMGARGAHCSIAPEAFGWQAPVPAGLIGSPHGFGLPLLPFYFSTTPTSAGRHQ